MTKILIVDNDTVFLEVYKKKFHAAGFLTVKTISDPEEVLGAIREFKPTLILMDLCWDDNNQSDMKGLDFLQEIKEDCNICNIPLVVMSRIVDGLPGSRYKNMENWWIQPRSTSFKEFLEFLQEKNLI